MDEAEQRIKKEQEMREREAREKERRRKAAIEMKKKKLEQRKAKDLYESSKRQDIEMKSNVGRPLQKMRQERLEQARARRKEKEACTSCW